MRISAEIAIFHQLLHGHENLISIIACKPINKKLSGIEVTILILASWPPNMFKKGKKGIFRGLHTVTLTDDLVGFPGWERERKSKFNVVQIPLINLQ